MIEEEFVLQEEYIELIKLLKFIDVASTGGEAKMMVEDGQVAVNNAIEYRKRKKIRVGDKVVVFDKIINIVGT